MFNWQLSLNVSGFVSVVLLSFVFPGFWTPGTLLEREERPMSDVTAEATREPCGMRA